MEDFGTLYIVQNTPGIVEYALLEYFWRNKEISASIDNSCEYVREYHCCNADLLRASLNAELRNILQSKENFQKFIDDRRKKVVSPACKSCKEYLSKMWDTEESLENVYNFFKEGITW